ncbi:hypothetical protein HS041_37840 [Planomonospora sp. ID67723]|uniref:hypothetical protein n=1 Tax=Planomonospora sp. ID67723 TaxID=2738134 RepID=UPI0018C44AAA|nr:hypothetical protein [Planomonospora sp. ID67723]MBG0833467.1 hypothetical protein [Planomonospora sp. ID67723]
MLRLHDTHSRQAEPIVPEGARSLRLYAFGPPVHRPAHLGDLRSWLLADLIRRTAERYRLRVLACRVAVAGPPPAVGDAPGPSHEEAFLSDSVALNVRPTDYPLGADQAADVVAGLAATDGNGRDHLTPTDAIALEAGARDGTVRWVRGGRLLFEGRELPAGRDEPGDAVRLGEVAAAGLDPLAVRLALLGHHYRREADLTWDALRSADGTLRFWRSRVATWSEAPSAPMPADRVARIEDALTDDLGTPQALRLMDELERDETIAPGSRFEAFLHLDQILALDLPAEIGRG